MLIGSYFIDRLHITLQLSNRGRGNFSFKIFINGAYICLSRYRSKMIFFVFTLLVTLEHLIFCLPLLALKIAIYQVRYFHRYLLPNQLVTCQIFNAVLRLQRNILLHGAFPLVEDELTSGSREKCWQNLLFLFCCVKVTQNLIRTLQDWCAIGIGSWVSWHRHSMSSDRAGVLVL